MLYWLAPFSDTISILATFRYITFRTGGAVITALALAHVLGPTFIAALGRQRSREIRPTGPIILATLLAATLLWANPINPYVWIAVGVAVAFGVVELVAECRRAGAQFALFEHAWIVISATAASLACFALAGQSSTTTSLAVPFGNVVDVEWLRVPIGAFVIVAAGQIVKLADRAHGSVPGTLLIAALGLLLTAYLSGNFVLAEYLDIRYVPRTGELAVLCGAAIGSGFGFLWLNGRSTSTSIGGTASLALGGMLGTVALATKHEIVFALICCLFVLKPARVQG